MTAVSTLYYSVHCDFPQCTAESGDDSDYSAWADVGQAYDSLDGSDWLTVDDVGDYCPKHIVKSAELDEDGDPIRVPAEDTIEFAFDLADERMHWQIVRAFELLDYKIRIAGNEDRRQIGIRQRVKRHMAILEMR